MKASKKLILTTAIIFGLASGVNVAEAVMITVDKEAGIVNCRGCRNKTIGGVDYVCTGSLSNETCTEKKKFINNWLTFDAKKAEKFNESSVLSPEVRAALAERDSVNKYNETNPSKVEEPNLFMKVFGTVF